MADPTDDDRRARILDAALAKFSAYGVARTSMADIAQGASMSRPALYQYYANKDDILSAVLERVLVAAADRAIAELAKPAELAVQLDGFLQRWYGDLTEQLSNTEHGADIVEAKSGQAKPVADAVNARLRRALSDRISVALEAPRSRNDVTDLVDLLMLSPHGCKYDAPTVARFRRRMTAFAHTVAGSIER